MKIPPAIRCVICKRPIEIDATKYVDEDGNPVHEPCYVERAAKQQRAGMNYFQSKFYSFV